MIDKFAPACPLAQACPGPCLQPQVLQGFVADPGNLACPLSSSISSRLAQCMQCVHVAFESDQKSMRACVPGSCLRCSHIKTEKHDFQMPASGEIAACGMQLHRVHLMRLYAMPNVSALWKTLQDMAELRRRHGHAGVRLRLRFKRGLHPFYPPSVELLQPRFCGPLLGALASHPLLQVRSHLSVCLEPLCPCCCRDATPVFLSLTELGAHQSDSLASSA